MYKVLVWNIRGAANVASMRRIKKLVRLHHISFLVLLEPMDDVNKLGSLTFSLGFSDYISSPNNKIWILWSSGFHAMTLSLTYQFLHLLVSHDDFIPT